jgi:hypothetical protein
MPELDRHPAVNVDGVPPFRVLFQYSSEYADVKVDEYKVSGKGTHEESRKRPRHAWDME